MTKIGTYIFKDKVTLEMALTHSSYSSKNYEKLEFLGDSILDFLIADILFNKKNLKEAELTRARAYLVSETALSKLFDKLNLKSLVRLGKSCPNVTKSIKCDIIESLIATIYLESGLEETKKFILDNFDLTVNEEKDYKTKFQEFAQKHKYSYEYILNKTEGPAHNLIFYVDLMLNGECVANAQANNKSEAEKLCAKQVLEKYKQI